MVVKVKNASNAAHLFENWQDTLIWSCLQGVMGEIYADAEEYPKSAMAVLGDFTFFTGEPMEELVLYKPEGCQQDFMIMVPQNNAWAQMIEMCYKESAKKVMRYALKKEQGVFEKEKLQRAVAALPQKYTLKMIDRTLFYQCREIDWCRDWVSQYKDFETYEKCGLGVVILENDAPVSGASSYSSYMGGIEVEIDTEETHRRQGLAYVCGAKLILECLARGLYPSWDAQNLWSVALAEKLGYHYDHEYTAYEILGY